jgi:hypothetical protein
VRIPRCQRKTSSPSSHPSQADDVGSFLEKQYS